MNVDALFVYGTLSPGRVNHEKLSMIDGEWAPGTVFGRLHDEGWGAELGCPAIELCENGDAVEGYVLSATNLSDFWPMLDEFEGDGYERVVTRVKLAGGGVVDACIYVLRFPSS